MTYLLRTAAVYNLLWAAATVAFPTQMFAWGGLAPPNYPAFVQSLGVLVGAFGIGYAIAAQDPVRHWGLVFVGLVGKVFVPITFAWAIAIGQLPSTFLLTILLNDVAWWAPFIVILLHAERAHAARSSRAAGLLADELRNTRLASGESLWDASFRQPLLIVFVRHMGCAFCREALSDIHQQGEQITSAGAIPVIVHQGSTEAIQRLLDRYGLKDVATVSDPDRRLFRAFELPLGSVRQIFGWRTFWRALAEGVVFRHGFGRIVGDPRQLAGAFLVHRGEIVRSFRSQTSADRTNYAELACTR